MSNRFRKTQVGDIYCIRSLKYDKWCAYQVIDIREERAGVLTLDWFDDNPPVEKDIPDLKPFIKSFGGWHNEFSCLYAETVYVPSQFVFIGNAEPLERIEINAYGSWPTD
ncbi:MAG: hypothetical protein JW822_14035 [Spirochaetales bacterium]|nr:hypothetical protein [Spirochaetales bacterium]